MARVTKQETCFVTRATLFSARIKQKEIYLSDLKAETLTKTSEIAAGVSPVTFLT